MMKCVIIPSQLLFMNYLIRQKFFLEGKVGVGVVGTELGFPEVIAVRTAANGKERRRLDALGDGESGEEVPPFLKVFNEIFGGRENIGDDDGAADEIFEISFGVSFENVFGGLPLPWFDEASEEVVVVFVNQRIAFSLCDVLILGEFGAWHDGEDAFGDDGSSIPCIEFSSQIVNLVLPEVGRCGKGAGKVAVEGAVADGRFRLVGVAGEDAAKGSGECGKDTAAAVACLHIFLHEAGQVDGVVRKGRPSSASAVSSMKSPIGTVRSWQPRFLASSAARPFVSSEL